MNKIFSVSNPTLAVLAVAAQALLLLSLTSCSSAKKQHPMGYLSKANIYHLEPGMRVETEDPMIRFEYMRHIRGAVENQEYIDRYGHYITAFWEGVDKSASVTVRLEYRQAKTGAKLFTIDSTPEKVRGRNTTDFAVTGESYAANGPVTAWRVVLLVNGAEADVFESFLWQ